MKMKRKVMLGIGTGMLALAALSGAAFAHGGVPGTSGDTMLDKLAAKLGIERSVLDEAIGEARAEVRTEALDARLAAAVTAGTITQAEADSIKSWLAAQPAALDSLTPGGGREFGHGFGSGGSGMPRSGGRHERGHGYGGHHGRGLGGMVMPYGGNEGRLAALVAAGTLTQEEADAVQAWLDSRPASLDELRHFEFAPEATPDAEGSSGDSSGTSTAASSA